MVSGEWQIYIVNEVRDLIDALDGARHSRVVHAIDTLAEAGPGLGRPLVDTHPRVDHRQPQRTPTRHRPNPSPSTLWRDSLLLVAGDKAGRWKDRYHEAIPLAEQRYERYLKERAAEEEQQR